MNKIFVINGLPGSGKTLFGEIVGARLDELDVDFLHTSSIKPIKELLMPEDEWGEDFKVAEIKEALRGLKRQVTHLDWDGETKDDFWRRAMSQLKYKVNEFDPTLIHSWVISRAGQMRDPFVVFVDIREPENIEGFKGFCAEQDLSVDVKSVLIVSDMAKKFNNRSDMAVLDGEYDIHVVNNRRRYEGNAELELKSFQREALSFVDRHIVSRSSKERV